MPLCIVSVFKIMSTTLRGHVDAYYLQHILPPVISAWVHTE